MGSISNVETAFAVGCLALAGPFVACADASFTATLTSYAAGRYEQCGYSAAQNWDSSASMTLWSIRAFQHTLTEASGVQSLTWCAELYQGLDLGSSYTFDTVAAEQAPSGEVAPGPMGALKAAAVRDLFARWINASNGNINGAPADRDAKSAAFQIVLWELTHENFTANSPQAVLAQMSLTTGAFRASITGATADWYGSIVQSLGVGGFQSTAIEGLTSSLAQDQLRLVPAPAAFALIGLGGLLNRRRR